MESIKFIDAFAGIGGFHIGIQKACKNIGILSDCVMAIEWDKDAASVYEKNHKIKPYGDITKINISDMPPSDILLGGFPCQPFSSAGSNHRLNNGVVSGDNRSNLFINLINYLHLHKPKCFLFENVKGILSAKNSDGSMVINTIAQYIKDAGYTLTIQNLSPHNFGVPQHRPRIFFAGVRDDITKKDSFIFPEPTNTPCCVMDVVDLTDNSGDFYKKASSMKNKKLPGTKADALLVDYKKRQKLHLREPKLKTALLCEINDDTPCARSRQADRVYSLYGVSPTITASRFLAPFEITDGDPTSWRWLSIKEVYELQSFPKEFIYSHNENKAHKQAGNAVNTKVVEIILEKMIKEFL